MNFRIYSMNGEDSATFVAGGLKIGDIDRIKIALIRAFPKSTFESTRQVEGLQPLDKNLFNGNAENASIAFAPDMPVDVAIDGDASEMLEQNVVVMDAADINKANVHSDNQNIPANATVNTTEKETLTAEEAMTILKNALTEADDKEANKVNEVKDNNDNTSPSVSNQLNEENNASLDNSVNTQEINTKIYIVPVKGGAVSSISEIQRRIEECIAFCKDNEITITEESVGNKKKFFVTSEEDANKLIAEGYRRAWNLLK